MAVNEVTSGDWEVAELAEPLIHHLRITERFLSDKTGDTIVLVAYRTTRDPKKPNNASDLAPDALQGHPRRITKPPRDR